MIIIYKEIYSIKGQETQNDGIDYYVYNFNEEVRKRDRKSIK